jgi:N6-L-threonylcarbamoyladenine synthase
VAPFGPVRILAIDTSCDESAAAVVDAERFRLLADEVRSHAAAMADYGGVVPELASREHVAALPAAVDAALTGAGLAVGDIDWVAVTDRPGLVGALLVGVSFAKAFAAANGIPFSTVHHLDGHLYSAGLAALEGNAQPPFPWIALVVSGGHTELYHVTRFGESRWLGGTLDDAAGEAFDKIGKQLGFRYPAGPALDRLVRERASEEHRTRHRFPVARPETPYAFSYSGLKTAVGLAIEKVRPLDDDAVLGLAASAQEAILAQLVQRCREALAAHPGARLVVTGGVACNSRLRALLPEAHFPKPRHCSDNAAMIALVAAWQHREGMLRPGAWDASVSPR